MKSTLLIMLVFASTIVFAQDTTYYSIIGTEVNSLKSCLYYEVIEFDEIDSEKITKKRYLKSGQIKLEENYYPYSEKKLNGKKRSWYDNGAIKIDANYINGKLNGELFTYWKNKQLKRHDFFENGELIKGKIWNADGIETLHYDFEILPSFPGGTNALMQFINKNIKYPKKASKKEIEGRVIVSFIVEKNGALSFIEVSESVDYLLDFEAIRIVEKMPKWEPGLIDGEKERFLFNLPVSFKLDND